MCVSGRETRGGLGCFFGPALLFGGAAPAVAEATDLTWRDAPAVAFDVMLLRLVRSQPPARRLLKRATGLFAPSTSTPFAIGLLL